MTDTPWSQSTLESRIADAATHRRHPGASPDPTEIAAYAAALPAGRLGSALVLGMTPELRSLALARFDRVLAVDHNPASIKLYRDWTPAADRPREALILGEWRGLCRWVGSAVDAVLGDGVFGNLPDIPAHDDLLREIASVLQPAGVFVTRTALIPDGFDPSAHCADRLIARFRAGELDEAEFGFGMRLVGHFESCQDPATHRLDNARLFAHCAGRHSRGELTDAEWQLMRRYYFGGTNCILPQREWEAALRRGGWDFSLGRCAGKAWYAYYPIYTCRRRQPQGPWPNHAR